MKKTCVILCILTVCLYVVACGTSEPELPELPDGQVYYRDHYYYVIDLTEDSISEYFTLTGPTSTIVQTNFGEGKTGATGSIAIKYKKVEQGGWVAWSDAIDKIIYIPSDYSEDVVDWVARNLADDPETSMSIEEAKQYISFLQ